jgi:precorrin-6x reductase
MSTLTYAGHDAVAAETAAARPARKSLFARLYETIVMSQQGRAEREIARYLANRGPLTDELEREIMRRLSGARPL